MIRVFLAMLLTTAMAVGQQPTPSEKSIVPVKTFSTEAGNPETIARILGDQFPGIAFSADAESATVFARVDGTDADRVERLIDEISIRANQALLERQARQAAGRRSMQNRQEVEMAGTMSNVEVLKTYQLKHVPAEEAARILNALGFQAETNIAAFGSSLVMRGPAATFEQVSTVLKEMDVPQKDTGAFAAAVVGQLNLPKQNDSRLFGEMFKQNPEQEVLESALNERLQALSTRLRERPDSSDAQKIKNELLKVVQQQFRMKMERERRELGQIQRRLEEVARRLEMQDRLSDRIVKQRVDQLFADDKRLMIQQERKWADQRLQRTREEAALSMRRDQLLALEQLEMALESLNAQQRQSGKELNEQQMKLQQSLKEQYEAFQQELQPNASLGSIRKSEAEPFSQSDDASAERARKEADRAQADVERAEVERDKALMQLEQLKAELEILTALQKQTGGKLDGQLAEKQVVIEQAYNDLEQKLILQDSAEGSAGQTDDAASKDQPSPKSDVKPTKK